MSVPSEKLPRDWITIAYRGGSDTVWRQQGGSKWPAADSVEALSVRGTLERKIETKGRVQELRIRAVKR